jgi:hypothetical protein
MILGSLLAVLLVAAAQAAHAEPAFPTGSRIGLEVPADLKVSTRFPGFEDAERKVAVEVLDLPRASYDDVMKSAFADEQSGARNVKRESFPYRAGTGTLVSGEVTQDGTALRMFFLIGSPAAEPGDNLVGFVRVAVPVSARDVYTDDVIRTMLATMTLRDVPLDEQLGQLPYSVKELAGFRVARIAPPGTILLVDGEGHDLSRQAHLIVAIGQGSAATADDRARAARNLMASAPFRDITLQMAESMRLANAPAYEIRAHAETANGSPVSIVQWVRFGPAGYMQIVGVSPRENWERLFPRFRAIRDGIGSR